ncbi:MAG: phosphoglycerate kinase, partial [Clostridiales bacterium]|nr:phosphoglycerate kinase [Clostridiales bacterium]
LLNNLVKKVNKLVISGGMAHTFMKASGVDTVNEPRRGPGGPEARKAAGAAALILFIAAKSGTSAAQM